MGMESLYHYVAELIEVIDGDTIIVDLKLGVFCVLQNVRIRLSGINAPEIATEEGVESKRWLQEELDKSAKKDGKTRLLLRTEYTKAGRDRHDKFGRLLAVVYRLTSLTDSETTSINSQSLQAGKSKPSGQKLKD